MIKGYLFDDGNFIGRVAHLLCQPAADFGSGATVLKLNTILEQLQIHGGTSNL